MAELILHHYPASPYSEKIRLILGAKRLAWRSVIIPTIMPKPDVVALTGGYRKTPLAQIGADIYCDTARIADLIETLAPEPPLFPREHAASARATARWADAVLFQTAIAVLFQPTSLQQTFGERGPGAPDLRAFMNDRIAMMKGATSRRPSLPEALATLGLLLREMDTQLGDGRAFLHGAAPAISDFAIYHSLWFVQRNPAAAQLLSGSRVAGWLQRVAALGHGTPTELSSGEAVEIARSSAPAPLKAESHAEGFNPGDAVEVLPTDYGLDASAGELVACTLDEIAIRRTDPRAGEVIVHFPRASYEIRKPA